MRRPYPRTPHLPWSPGASADDVRGGEPYGLVGREVVVTEKLDGENTTLYADGSHARSLDSGHHPSRAWVKALQGRVGHLIPYGWRVCGENVYVRHSIAYDALESWFYGFSVWDDGDRCLDWDRTVRFLRRLGIPTPPVLWRGVYDEKALRGLRLDTARQEGYVVRTVEGFAGEEFGRRVAKWVRREHVQTDVHWMYAPVVPNGLGPAAALWEVRSGGTPDVRGLSAAVGVRPDAKINETVAEVVGGLHALGRTGDARLAGVLAVLLRRGPRAWVAGRLAGSLGVPLARRVADLVGLYDRLWSACPDEERRGGLVRMSFAADLGVLHAVARACLAGRSDAEAEEARAQVEWSALHAEDAGLLGEDPLEPLRAGFAAELADAGVTGDAADRCWAAAREAYADGRVRSAAEAVAATWRWRPGGFPRLIHLVGPAGSGKSTFAANLPGVDARVSLDDLREARGARADQRANADVLREGLDRLDAALAKGGAVVWDATSLTRHQRALVHAVARRRDALITHAVLLVDEDELARRNAVRSHPVPPEVLTAQLRRFAPPYPGHAHRTWYVGADGAIGDVDGVLSRAGDVWGTDAYQ
jgi:predicted kinase